MCCRVSTFTCLLFCWNPTPVSFSTISEGFLKLSCRHMRYLLFPPGHLLLVCPPPPLNVPFSYQGHPVVGTQAPWKHLPWNPVYFSQMEGLPWGDPPRVPEVLLGVCLQMPQRAATPCPADERERVHDGKHSQTVLLVYMTVNQYFGCKLSLNWCERNIFIWTLPTLPVICIVVSFAKIYVAMYIGPKNWKILSGI